MSDTASNNHDGWTATYDGGRIVASRGFTAWLAAHDAELRAQIAADVAHAIDTHVMTWDEATAPHVRKGWRIARSIALDTITNPKAVRSEVAGDVPVVAVGAGEEPPWAKLSLNCPICGEGPLPLEDSVPPGLQFIAHCEGVWLRGGIGI